MSNRGRLVARLVPMHGTQNAARDPRATITTIDELAAQLSADLPEDLDFADVIALSDASMEPTYSSGPAATPRAPVVVLDASTWVSRLLL